MKTLKFYAMLLTLAATSVSFVACSDDDDDKGNNSEETVAASIVGTWEASEDDATITITFNSSGEGVVNFKDKTTSVTETFSFNYDGDEKYLQTRNSSYLRSTYTNVLVTSKNLYLGNNTFERKSGGNGAKSVVGSIIGTWRASENDATMTITFNSSGEGTCSYKDKTISATETFSYNYDAKKKSMTIRGSEILDPSYNNIIVTEKRLFLGGWDFER